MWTKENLWKLRQEIGLCSLFVADYQNSFGVEEHVCCDFFEGYADFLENLMIEDFGEDYDYFYMLDEYDNPENLYNWYGCYADGDPLPITEKE